MEMMNLTGNACDFEGMDFDEDTIDFTLTPNSTARCVQCSEPIIEYANGWVHEDAVGDADLCGYIDRDDIRSELEVGDDAEITNEMILEDTNYTFATRGGTTGAQMVNWVGMTIAERSAEVQISVTPGDDRGCFTMRVWQGEDADGNPCLYLTTPHPSNSQPHMTLEHHYDGVYRIVGS